MPAASWPSSIGSRATPVAVDDAQVGVADAGGLDAHEEFAGPGRIELELADA